MGDKEERGEGEEEEEDADRAAEAGKEEDGAAGEKEAKELPVLLRPEKKNKTEVKPLVLNQFSVSQ